MGSSPGLNELKEGEREWRKFHQRLWQKRMSRRKVFKVSAMLALVGSGSVSQFLAACGEEEQKAAQTGTPSTGATGTGTATPFAGVTGDWDTTGTPPYKLGLPDDAAKVPEQWKQFPWTYKYGWWRHNWETPVYRGGHLILSGSPPANYDAMVGNGIQLRSVSDGLYNIAVREGSKPLGPTFESLLALKEEHNADYTSWTVTIPDNVKWHNIAPVNGRAMTVEDVVFSFERHRDTSVFKTVLRNIDKITAVDKTHVRFDFKRPEVNFIPTVALPHFVVFAPEHFENKDLFKSKPIGTGPFIVEFSEFQNRAEFVRNPEYWRMPPVKPEKYGNKPLPLLDKVTRPFYATLVAQKEAFFNGKIDLWAPGCQFDSTILKEELKQIPDANVMVTPYYVCCPWGILFQYKNPLFQDIRVRKAMSMAINREQIWRDVADKGNIIGADPIPLDLAGYEFPPALKEYGANVQFNPQQAKQLMREAGYNDPVKLTVYNRTTTPLWAAALDSVVFNLKQAGVADVQIVLREPQVHLQDKINKSFPDLLYEDCCPLPQGYTLDAMVAPVFLPDSPANYGSINDADLTALFEKQAATSDPGESAKLARQIGGRIVDNVDHLWFGWSNGMEVTRSWLHGMVLSTRTCHHGFGQYNYSYVWTDDKAPDGRGGKRV